MEKKQKPENDQYKFCISWQKNRTNGHESFTVWISLSIVI